MPITLNGTTGIVSPALDSDSSLTVGPAVMATPTGSAPLYAARAWVNFNGINDTTDVVSTANTNRLIRASGNVASVLRNSVGSYTITFTTAMPNANYLVLASSTTDLASTADTVTVGVIASNETNPPTLKTTTQVTIGTGISGGTPAADCAEVYVAFFC